MPQKQRARRQTLRRGACMPRWRAADCGSSLSIAQAWFRPADLAATLSNCGLEVRDDLVLAFACVTDVQNQRRVPTLALCNDDTEACSVLAWQCCGFHANCCRCMNQRQSCRLPCRCCACWAVARSRSVAWSRLLRCSASRASLSAQTFSLTCQTHPPATRRTTRRVSRRRSSAPLEGLMPGYGGCLEVLEVAWPPRRSGRPAARVPFHEQAAARAALWAPAVLSVRWCVLESVLQVWLAAVHSKALGAHSHLSRTPTCCMLPHDSCSMHCCTQAKQNFAERQQAFQAQIDILAVGFQAPHFAAEPRRRPRATAPSHPTVTPHPPSHRRCAAVGWLAVRRGLRRRRLWSERARVADRRRRRHADGDVVRRQRRGRRVGVGRGVGRWRRGCWW